MEGSQISIKEAMDFLQSGQEAQDIEELMLLKNCQAGNFAAQNIYHPINERLGIFVLAGINYYAHKKSIRIGDSKIIQISLERVLCGQTSIYQITTLLIPFM